MTKSVKNVYPEAKTVSPYHHPQCPGLPRSLYTPPNLRALGRASWFSFVDPICEIHTQNSWHFRAGRSLGFCLLLPAPNIVRSRTQVWFLVWHSFHHSTLLIGFYSPHSQNHSLFLMYLWVLLWRASFPARE